MTLEQLAEALRKARRHRDSLSPGTEEWRAAQRIVEALRDRLDEAGAAFVTA
jgi:hypothetical protein